MSVSARGELSTCRRWVIKLGSNVLLRKDRKGVDRVVFASLVEDVVWLLDQGCEVTIVSSGAVALGKSLIPAERYKRGDIPVLQALAALGQPHLLRLYDEEFAHYQRLVAQVLLSRGDLDDRKRYLNARHALHRLQAMGVVPIINENDTVATEELRFGDNDQLAAMACGVVGGDVLVILSDVDGVFDVSHDESGGRVFGDRIGQAGALDEYLMQIAGPSVSGVGTGGMSTKILAARKAATFGVSTMIAPGKRQGVLRALYEGADVGTLLTVDGAKDVTGKKVWLSAGAMPVGRIICDAGACQAVMEKGASVLPVGVLGVDGDFTEGDVIELVNQAGERFAVGLAVYDGESTRRLVGAHTEEIMERLGYHVLDCVVHRDNLVIST